eukprot:scaffold560_cov97-Cylindrotheca_fusiformis.AAC.1
MGSNGRPSLQLDQCRNGQADDEIALHLDPDLLSTEIERLPLDTTHEGNGSSAVPEGPSRGDEEHSLRIESYGQGHCVASTPQEPWTSGSSAPRSSTRHPKLQAKGEPVGRHILHVGEAPTGQRHDHSKDGAIR